MDYKFKNKQTGEIENVSLERWVWGALYLDGTELHQFDNKGIFHQIGEIDQDRLKTFTLYKPREDEKRIDMPFVKGMKLIYKYKMVRPHYLNDFVRIYCMGYKFEGRYHFTFILPDDRMIISPVENVDLTQFELK